MKRNRLVLCLFVLLTLSFTGLGDACTTFRLPYDGGWVFGKNLDWMIEKGLVVVNKRNVFKMTGPEEESFTWTSKYGSVTFNMYGCGMPMGGVNEKGLVIDNMWLRETTYPEPDSRPGLSELQWVQYQLDTAETVDDVIASDSKVRIGSDYGAPLHFLIADGKGGSAVIEFLDGEMVYHKGENLPVTALTNTVYKDCLDFMASYAGEDTSAAYRETAFSRARFMTAAERVEAFDPKESGSPVDYALATLDSVSNEATQWSIVYDPMKTRVYFRTKSNRNIRYIDLGAFDYSCESPVKVFDMSAGEAGDVSDEFIDYSYEANYDLVEHSFSKTPFLKDTPVEFFRTIARYPEAMRCVE